MKATLKQERKLEDSTHPTRCHAVGWSVFKIAIIAPRDEPCRTDAQLTFLVVRRFVWRLKSMTDAAGLKHSKVSRERLITRSDDGYFGLPRFLRSLDTISRGTVTACARRSRRSRGRRAGRGVRWRARGLGELSPGRWLVRVRRISLRRPARRPVRPPSWS